MKTLTCRSHAFITLGSIFLGITPGLFATEQVLQKVPPLAVEQTPAYPENLARHYLGARIEASISEAGDLKAADTALLSGDPTSSYALATGPTTLLVALPRIENIDLISLATKGLKGTMTIATSNAKLPADSPKWRAAAEQDLSAADLRVKVGPSEAKYVRLSFNVTQPGQIAAFGIYANPQVSDFTSSRSRKMTEDKSGGFGFVSFNYTDMHAKARALYVSSGADLRQANNMIDDQAATTYSFAAQDGSPTAVIDLGKSVGLRRLSAIYSPRAGRMDFYVLQALPTESGNVGTTQSERVQTSALGDDAKTMTINDAAWANLKTVGVVTDDGGQGRASVEFPETSGRYVMLRWTPTVQQDDSFALAEVAAFAKNKTLLAANTEDSGDTADTDESAAQTSDGKTMLDGKTMIDAKDMPGEGPEEIPQSPGEGPPPTLPQPPPFTFVPVLVPNSP